MNSLSRHLLFTQSLSAYLFIFFGGGFISWQRFLGNSKALSESDSCPHQLGIKEVSIKSVCNVKWFIFITWAPVNILFLLWFTYKVFPILYTLFLSLGQKLIQAHTKTSGKGNVLHFIFHVCHSVQLVKSALNHSCEDLYQRFLSNEMKPCPEQSSVSLISPEVMSGR